MKRINLVVLSLCLGILCLFGFNNKEYEISNSVYMNDNNSNLIGKAVNVKGLDCGFNILSLDGERARMLADCVVKKGYSYNFSGDGHTPVAFEKSMLYQGLQDGTKTWKDDIVNAGGKTDIFLVDIPTEDEIITSGKLETDLGFATEQTPDWICLDDGYFTKTVSSGFVIKIDCVKQSGGKIKVINYSSPNSVEYGHSIRPILETSVYNLVSSDSDVQEYINKFYPNISDEKDDSSNNDNAQFVKVPSTGMNAEIIFTVVGISIILIAGIVIYVIVKEKRSKK